MAFYLRAIREAHGLTQKQIAKMIGKQSPVISKYENGSLSPSVEDLERIASQLGIDVSAFFLPPEPALAATPED